MSCVLHGYTMLYTLTYDIECPILTWYCSSGPDWQAYDVIHHTDFAIVPGGFRLDQKGRQRDCRGPGKWIPSELKSKISYSDWKGQLLPLSILKLCCVFAQHFFVQSWTQDSLKYRVSTIASLENIDYSRLSECMTWPCLVLNPETEKSTGLLWELDSFISQTSCVGRRWWGTFAWSKPNLRGMFQIAFARKNQNRYCLIWHPPPMPPTFPLPWDYCTHTCVSVNLVAAGASFAGKKMSLVLIEMQLH